MNRIFKNRQISILFFLTPLLFINCEETKVENCIEEMHVEYLSENPGPDVVSFKFNSNYEELDANLENIALIELFFNEKDVFRSSGMFELQRVTATTYILKMATPHFFQVGYHTEKEIYDFYERSVDLKIVLTNEKETFTFVKCIK